MSVLLLSLDELSKIQIGCLCRGLRISAAFSPPGQSDYAVTNENVGNQQHTQFGVHSHPNYYLAENALTGSVTLSMSITLQDDAGALFGLRSFWLDGSFFAGCGELLTVSGTTNGGQPNPACSATASFLVGNQPPSLIKFVTPCFATAVTINAVSQNPDCIAGVTTYVSISLDDITVCPTSTANAIG